MLDIMINDISCLTSAQLVSAITHSDAKSNMPVLREMIMVAEDTHFTIDQSKQLSPWLLNFAKEYCDSDDFQDKDSVLSAIRTGDSMLIPSYASSLIPLLKPGHFIETNLVTVKMIGRIFEAQPPSKIDEYCELSDEICLIAKSLLNQNVIIVSQSAAMAQLSVYALLAMASSKVQQMVEIIQQFNKDWFSQQILRKFYKLRNIWINRSTPIAEQPLELLNNMIQTMKNIK